MIRATSLLLFLFLLHTPYVAWGKPTLQEISRAVDRMYRADTSHGTMRMIVTTPDYKRELEMEVWTRGQDDTLVRIDSPKKEKGTATLKKGNEMWNYLPKIKKTIRVPPSMMMGSWMGSDFTNDDMVKSSSWEEDYTAAFSDTSPQGQICVDYQAKPDAPVAWDKVVICIDEKSYLPVRQDFYDEKGRRMREMIFTDVKTLGGRTIPTKMILRPLSDDKKGNETQVLYDDMEFNVNVPDELFTLTNLERD